MKKYAFSYSVKQTFDSPVTRHAFILRCMPGTFPFQRSYAHKLKVKPHAALTFTGDSCSNELYSGTIDKAHTGFSYESSGFVLSSRYVIHEPLDRIYLFPSEMTRPTPAMIQMVRTASLPEDPWARAKALCQLTYRLINFVPGDGAKTAAETFASGKGNARDFAHVFLALCRLSGIPARLVSGLAVGIPGPTPGRRSTAAAAGGRWTPSPAWW